VLARARLPRCRAMSRLQEAARLERSSLLVLAEEICPLPSANTEPSPPPEQRKRRGSGARTTTSAIAEAPMPHTMSQRDLQNTLDPFALRKAQQVPLIHVDRGCCESSRTHASSLTLMYLPAAEGQGARGGARSAGAAGTRIRRARTPRGGGGSTGRGARASPPGPTV
jgi:hypothetical protein